MKDKYADLLFLSRPVSKIHRPMSRSSRAAQFAPFAALTGYEEAIEETARWTDTQLFISDDQISIINQQLQILRQNLNQTIEVTYFVPDKRKTGGHYLTVKSRIRKIDELFHQIVLFDGTIIPMKQIFSLKIL